VFYKRPDLLHLDKFLGYNYHDNCKQHPSRFCFVTKLITVAINIFVVLMITGFCRVCQRRKYIEFSQRRRRFPASWHNARWHIWVQLYGSVPSYSPWWAHASWGSLSVYSGMTAVSALQIKMVPDVS